MTTDTQVMTKRSLILRDTVALLALLTITAALFTVTLLLFRGFKAHRALLAQQWADRGRAAFDAQQPQQALVAYRTALSYAPGDRAFELRLAQALGAAGHTDEAYAYFLGLWESRPGDGFLNLQLARLAATRRDPQAAIEFYRASIYGTWEGDGLLRRREVRLELARFLIAQHQPGAARAELLVAGGNAANSPAVYLALAHLFEQADAPGEALSYYRKVLALDPSNADALNAAGRLSFAAADYLAARSLLQRAQRQGVALPQDAALLAQATRLLELAPAANLQPTERVRRILAARSLARKRLLACTSPDSALLARWSTPEATPTRTALLRDPDRQTAAIDLIYATELGTSRCGPPTGDDALLLLLAQHLHVGEVGDR